MHTGVKLLIRYGTGKCILGVVSLGVRIKSITPDYKHTGVNLSKQRLPSIVAEEQSEWKDDTRKVRVNRRVTRKTAIVSQLASDS